MIIDHHVEQAIRRSHCSHKDRGEPQHQCIGDIPHYAPGITLDCTNSDKSKQLAELNALGKIL